MREIRLHDTRSGKLQTLAPREPGRVGIYACGPTVYGRIHVGNARPFAIFSVLKRFLAHEGYAVRLVMNVTDVNDKIYVAARAAADRADAANAAADGGGGGSAELARAMTQRYIADTDALGLGRPDAEPLASESMASIIAYIEALIERGSAYAVDYAGADEAIAADVYFRVRSDPAYGSLSHRKLDDMDQGEGVEGAERKHDPLDFALWKARKPDEDTWWNSPWGPGRPGWHIECSAMAEAELGVGFDIHGGGADLIFPHHENEAAQTRCARGAELTALWMHNGMVQMTGEKMAKSQGNIAPLHELTERFGGAAVLLYLLSGHYRQPLAFSEEALAQAASGIERIREALRHLRPGAASPVAMAEHKEQFFAALADDFNTPRALAALLGWVREANRRSAEADAEVGDEDLREMLAVLGLGALEPPRAAGGAEGIDPEAERLRDQREQARSEGDWARADALREQLRALGYELRDSAAGPELFQLT